MPREEIQGSSGIADMPQKAFSKGLIVDGAAGVASDLNAGECCFNHLCRRLIQAIVGIRLTDPHIGFCKVIVRLIPDLPVGNIEGKPISPPLRVVPDDANADLSPLSIVLRRININLVLHVFDDGSQAI